VKIDSSYDPKEYMDKLVTGVLDFAIRRTTPPERKHTVVIRSVVFTGITNPKLAEYFRERRFQEKEEGEFYYINEGSKVVWPTQLKSRPPN